MDYEIVLIGFFCQSQHITIFNKKLFNEVLAKNISEEAIITKYKHNNKTIAIVIPKYAQKL